MSKLKELIEKLCPNGVEFKELQEICNVSIGEFVHKNKQREVSPLRVVQSQQRRVMPSRAA